MKKLLLPVFPALLWLAVSCSEQAEVAPKQAATATSAAAQEVYPNGTPTTWLLPHIHVHKPRTGCTGGLGLCGGAINHSHPPYLRSGDGWTFSTMNLDAGTLTVAWYFGEEAKAGAMEIEDDWLMPDALAAGLGYQQVTILKGSYPFNEQIGKFGGYKMKVVTK